MSSNPSVQNCQDETYVTEITIRPDGRVYVFGLSAGVVEVLAALRPSDAVWNRRLEQVRAAFTDMNEPGQS